MKKATSLIGKKANGPFPVKLIKAYIKSVNVAKNTVFRSFSVSISLESFGSNAIIF